MIVSLEIENTLYHHLFQPVIDPTVKETGMERFRVGGPQQGYLYKVWYNAVSLYG